MPDFDLTEEILHIMATLDKFPACCRENLLKMVAAWEKDVIELRRQRDDWRKKAEHNGL